MDVGAAMRPRWTAPREAFQQVEQPGSCTIAILLEGSHRAQHKPHVMHRDVRHPDLHESFMQFDSVLQIGASSGLCSPGHFR